MYVVFASIVRFERAVKNVSILLVLVHLHPTVTAVHHTIVGPDLFTYTVYE